MHDPMMERTMQNFYGTLCEKDKRRYAAIKALKLRHGGIVYMEDILSYHRAPSTEGVKELHTLSNITTSDPPLRQSQGRRKRYEEKYPDIDTHFLDVLQKETTGDPMDAQVRWTDLTPKEIAALLASIHKIRVSVPVVKKLLKKHNRSYPPF